jgi:hypothetical protein
MRHLPPSAVKTREPSNASCDRSARATWARVCRSDQSKAGNEELTNLRRGKGQIALRRRGNANGGDRLGDEGPRRLASDRAMPSWPAGNYPSKTTAANVAADFRESGAPSRVRRSCGYPPRRRSYRVSPATLPRLNEIARALFRPRRTGEEVLCVRSFAPGATHRTRRVAYPAKSSGVIRSEETKR